MDNPVLGRNKEEAGIPRGTNYFHFTYCKVINYLGVARCFMCHGYGRVANHCDKKKSSCSHCLEERHLYADCKIRISGQLMLHAKQLKTIMCSDGLPKMSDMYKEMLQ